MEKEDYQKLINLKLKLGLAESCACELYEAIKEANQAIRDMILKKDGNNQH